ncbi:MAG: ABC-F family ATP-binding cassette domain-containing protein [Actinobacteria bacterium]|nr:ABC-F family ATP-binding cassette domain-containing protein [Actinomycetota bacterium]
MGHLLGAEGLHIKHQTGVLFDSVTLGVEEGDRIGIVGRNGEGKSTLLKMLAGTVEPDGGRVTLRRGTTVGMLHQSDLLDADQTAGHSIVGDVPDHVWARDPRIRQIVDALVSELPWEGKVGILSGGQRRRVDLAKVLVTEPDILLLDEPTNHLDVDAITWLADHVKRRWPSNSGALLVVTHDRWFLDEVSTATWEVHDRIVEPFEGGYSAYVLQRVERDRMAAVVERKRQNLMRKELAWLRRGPPARTTKPKFRVDAAEALIADEPPLRNPVELKRLASARLGREVVTLADASVSFGDRQILRDIEWHIGPGERTGILGANGAGKTTLLRLITGDLPPTTGEVKHGKTVKIATLSQEPDELNELANQRVSDVINEYRTSYAAGGKEMTPAQLLEGLGFASAKLSSPVGRLSGGQKRRLQLLLTLLGEPNVLILDEPSNDLDIDMLTAMEDLLDSWPGTLLVASHDRYMIERVTDQQYALLDGRLRHLPGGVEQYLKLRHDSIGRAPTASNTGTPAHRAKSDVAARRSAAKKMASIERQLQKMPEQVEQAGKLVAAYDQTDYEGLMTHVKALDELKAKQSELETRWLELSEQLGED